MDRHRLAAIAAFVFIVADCAGVKQNPGGTTGARGTSSDTGGATGSGGASMSSTGSGGTATATGSGGTSGTGLCSANLECQQTSCMIGTCSVPACG